MKLKNRFSLDYPAQETGSANSPFSKFKDALSATMERHRERAGFLKEESGRIRECMSLGHYDSVRARIAGLHGKRPSCMSEAAVKAFALRWAERILKDGMKGMKRFDIERGRRTIDNSAMLFMIYGEPMRALSAHLDAAEILGRLEKHKKVSYNMTLRAGALAFRAKNLLSAADLHLACNPLLSETQETTPTGTRLYEGHVDIDFTKQGSINGFPLLASGVMEERFSEESLVELRLQAIDSLKSAITLDSTEYFAQKYAQLLVKMSGHMRGIFLQDQDSCLDDKEKIAVLRVYDAIADILAYSYPKQMKNERAFAHRERGWAQEYLADFYSAVSDGPYKTMAHGTASSLLGAALAYEAAIANTPEGDLAIAEDHFNAARCYSRLRDIMNKANLWEMMMLNSEKIGQLIADHWEAGQKIRGSAPGAQEKQA